MTYSVKISMQIPASKSALLKDYSLWALIFSNLITIFIALHEGWNLPEVMLAYWFQSVIIGVFNFIRILQLREFSTEGLYINNQLAEPTSSTKTYTAFFFLAHYGIFHFIYLTAIINPHLLSKELLTWNSVILILPTIAIFFADHLFSYIYNRPKDSKRQNIGTLMFYPYARILPMHFTIIFGAGLVNSSAGKPLLLFLALKTLADIIMHVVERHIRSREE